MKDPANKIHEIKTVYDCFNNWLLSKGRLPLWSTKNGFWSGSIINEVHQAFQNLKPYSYQSFLDLGSGDGRVVAVASLFFNKAEGVEIDDWLHKQAQNMNRHLRCNTTLHNKNFHDHNVSDYDLVFINPDKPFHRGTEEKLLKELKGDLLVYGSEFRPQQLNLKKEFSINGTKVGVYSNKE